ncbi:MAG TPA: PEP-CTERM sorting domain-containing protein [Rhodanobacteraceae bacterium]|jgi:hypothetical protein|nr:PEP-CTERM sorting domain-containing protein [Rhodanobacteraceae bacterium]
MNRFNPLRVCASTFLALGAALALSVPGAASASPYVVKLVQQGADVVATGSGEFNLAGLAVNALYQDNGSGLYAADGYVMTGTGVGRLDGYTGFAGPANFGAGGFVGANGGAGDNVGIYGGTSSYGYAVFWVPQGYVSGTGLSGSAIWNNASFASLGMTPGTYTWTWGTSADQSFTLMIGGATAVPEPTALGMLGLGVLLMGGLLIYRRRQPRPA